MTRADSTRKVLGTSRDTLRGAATPPARAPHHLDISVYGVAADGTTYPIPPAVPRVGACPVAGCGCGGADR